MKFYTDNLNDIYDIDVMKDFNLLKRFDIYKGSEDNLISTTWASEIQFDIEDKIIYFAIEGFKLFHTYIYFNEIISVEYIEHDNNKRNTLENPELIKVVIK